MTRLERLINTLNLLETAYSSLIVPTPTDDEVDAIELIRHAKRAILRAINKRTPWRPPERHA